MKTCSKCGLSQDESNYYAGERQCKDCKRKANRARQLWKLYGVTEETYDQMLEAQNGQCAICKATENNNKRMKYFCVDHDHATGKVRQLLCQECNFFLGKLEKYLPTLDRFFDYIETNS